MRSGFTLVEVMIASAMMSGTAMLMATMAKQTAVQNSTQLARTNLDNEITAWRSLLGDNAACVTAFSGIAMPGGVSDTYTGVQSITAGGLVLQIGALLGTGNTQITGLQLLGVGSKYLGATITPSSSASYVSPSAGAVTVKTLVTALRISVGPPPSVTTTPAGSTSIQRDIGMIISYDTTSGAIRACTSFVNQQTMCGELGGTIYNGLCTQWQQAMALQSVAIGSNANPGSTGGAGRVYFDSGGNATISNGLSVPSSLSTLSSLTAGATSLNALAVPSATTSFKDTLTVAGATRLGSLAATSATTSLTSTLVVTSTSNLSSLTVPLMSTFANINATGSVSFTLGLNAATATADVMTANTSLVIPVNNYSSLSPANQPVRYASCPTKGQVIYTSTVGLYVCNDNFAWDLIGVDRTAYLCAAWGGTMMSTGFCAFVSSSTPPVNMTCPNGMASTLWTSTTSVHGSCYSENWMHQGCPAQCDTGSHAWAYNVATETCYAEGHGSYNCYCTTWEQTAIVSGIQCVAQ